MIIFIIFTKKTFIFVFKIPIIIFGIISQAVPVSFGSVNRQK